jgi:hypothetical protein
LKYKQGKLKDVGMPRRKEIEGLKAKVASACLNCGLKWRTRAKDDIANPAKECKECYSKDTTIVNNPEEHEEFVDNRTRIPVR